MKNVGRQRSLFLFFIILTSVQSADFYRTQDRSQTRNSMGGGGGVPYPLATALTSNDSTL